MVCSMILKLQILWKILNQALILSRLQFSGIQTYFKWVMILANSGPPFISLDPSSQANQWSYTMVPQTGNN